MAPRTKLWPYLFCGSCVVGLFVARWPFILYNVPLNPDEAQMIANAMKYAFDFVSWRSVDSTSSGPLNSMVLMWPYFFGGAVTFASARITGAALTALSLIMIVASLGRVSAIGRFGAAGAMALFLISTRSYNYAFYSSELLSVALACFGFYVVTRSYPSRWMLFAGGMALGAVPFAKLQGVPVAIMLGFVLLWRVGSAARLLALLLGAIGPALLILLPLAASGELSEVWDSYLMWTASFASGRLDRSSGISLLRVLQTDPQVDVYLAGLVLFGALGAVLSRRWPSMMAILSAAWLALAFVSILMAGTIVDHYLIFLFAPAAAFAGSLWIGGRSRADLIVGGAVTLILLVAIGAANSMATTWLNPSPLKYAAGLFGAGSLMSWLPKTDGRLTVWGWEPSIHVYSGMAPATRDTHNWNQIEPSAMQERFRGRMIEDFIRSPPAVVVDAVAPGSFHYTDAAQAGLSTFPALASIVQREYTLVSKNGAECPRTYISNRLLPQMKFVEIKDISATASLQIGDVRFSPSLVDDFNTYEKCVDRWLLPDATPGSITLRFAPAAVSAVRILNTRNGAYATRATKTATVVLSLGDRVVKQETLELLAYPDWTILRGPAAQIDSVRIDVLTFAGDGGGLNEIKIERSDQ